jgi:alcohol dehydrogenase (cytochrome c)
MRLAMILPALIVAVLATPSAARAEGGPSQAELDAAEQSTDWPLPNHDYAGRRFVDARQITHDNAAQLKPACTFHESDLTPFQANPLEYQGTLYISTRMATIALDAATCALRWRHDWQPQEGGAGAATVYRSRGVALKDGTVMRSTAGGSLIALDAGTGRLLWEKTIANADKKEVVTMAPLVYGDLVIAGAGISEYGVKGWIGGFRLADGEPVWRFNTVPSDGEPGAETWQGTPEKERGGGGLWVTPTLDTAAGSLYVPVGNPAPDFFGGARLGQNLYTASLLVLDARTGKLKWYRQFVAHDTHDWDLTVASPLYEATIGGARRALVAAAGKDGILRAVDRDSHDVVFAVPLTTIANAEAEPTPEGVHTCPGVLGGFQWSAPAFDPAANLLIAPTVDWCGTFRRADEVRHIPGQFNLGGSYSADPDNKGWLTAVDAATGAVAWKYRSQRPMLAAVTATSAGLVFTGELTGDFLVLDAAKGDVLYRYNTGAPVAAGVITYMVGGKQYAAAVSGATVGFWRTAAAAAAVTVFALP